MILTRNAEIAHYLTLIGGGLTLLTSIVVLSVVVVVGGSTSVERGISAYFAYSYFSAGAALILTMPTSLITIYLSRLYLRRTDTQGTVSLIVMVVSIIAAIGMVWSGIFLLLGLFFSGPPISFLGGLLGAMSGSRQKTEQTRLPGEVGVG